MSLPHDDPAAAAPADAAPTGAGLPFPTVREVGVGAPLRWLARGWVDLKSAPIASLFYGFCFHAMGLLITVTLGRAYEYVAFMTTGFLLLGPFLAIGLCELSRRRERGEALRLRPTLTVWLRNAGNIGLFTVVLGVIFLVWARASLVVFAVFYPAEMPSFGGFVGQVIALENLDFLIAYFGVGFVFAALAFAASVVSIPLMLDRNQDAVSAILASFAALTRNPLPLALWAFLIAALTIVGFLSFHVGLIVLMPILGHATWHAYRELVVALPGGARQ